MNPDRLLCRIVAAPRHRVYYRNDVQMENKRADAARRCLGLCAPCSYSPCHKTTALSQGSLGEDREPSVIRTLPTCHHRATFSASLNKRNGEEEFANIQSTAALQTKLHTTATHEHDYVLYEM